MGLIKGFWQFYIIEGPQNRHPVPIMGAPPKGTLNFGKSPNVLRHPFNTLARYSL